MFQSVCRMSCTALALILALPAAAQTSLGLARIEATAGLTADGTDSLGQGRLSGDFRITDAHGLQFDISATDYAGGFLGQVDAHLYLMPGRQAKYGLFASLADVDGREATVAYAGAEGLWALSDRTTVAARAGLGYARPGNLDFIAADARIDHALSADLGLFASASLAEVQEQALDALPWGAELGLTWHPASAPVAVSAALGTAGLSGRDGGGTETYLRIGLTWSFGADRSADRPLSDRGFTAPAPFDPLLRLGRF